MVVPFPVAPRPAGFTARLSGDIQSELSGEAGFSAQPAPDGFSWACELFLGHLGAQGGVVLRWVGRSGPSTGHYWITGGFESSDHVRGRVFLGPAERPIAELDAESGTLTIAESRDGVVRGSFTLAAVGRERAGSSLHVRLTGSFTARVR